MHSIMYTASRRRITTAIYTQKTIVYGLKSFGKANPGPLHREFGTFLTSNAVRHHLCQRKSSSSPAALRYIHARALSYSSIPRFVARAFRVPIAGATIGAGGLGYANYKFEGESLALSPLDYLILRGIIRVQKQIFSMD